MITEYNTRSAVPIGGGERVAGYLRQHLIDGDLSKTKTRAIIEWDSMNEAGKVYRHSCEVDPTTIEPIKVKVRYEHEECRCPNCNAWFYAVNKNDIDNDWLSESTPFCGNCGMALDWED